MIYISRYGYNEEHPEGETRYSPMPGEPGVSVSMGQEAEHISEDGHIKPYLLEVLFTTDSKDKATMLRQLIDALKKELNTLGWTVVDTSHD